MVHRIRCPKCGRTRRVSASATVQDTVCLECARATSGVATQASKPTIAIAAGAEAVLEEPLPQSSPPPAATENRTVLAPQCPRCRVPLVIGAVACLECGFVLPKEPDAKRQASTEHCPNPACGTALTGADRVCRRCGAALPTPAGTVLHNRYRIERQLALGGFGIVYLATDTKENRTVAIKDMICLDAKEFSLRLNFFRREAEILRSLEQLPIVPRVYDLIEFGQTVQLVMEYIEGRDLLQTLEANGQRPFPVEQVIVWGKSICDVLIQMHGRAPPLVHRDLKPDNLMLVEPGRQLKMIDFGTARDMGRTRQSRLVVKTRIYTEGYAPPEQILGKPEPRSDLFALAGTLYHLATGRCPEGTQTAQELKEQLADPHNPLSKSNGWFFELLQINLAEDPNARYFSAREFKDDLERERVTRELLCPACRAANPVRQPYCGKCGGPLTDPTPSCSDCGQVNRMGSRFCIHCGHRLR